MSFSLAAQVEREIYIDGNLKERKVFADSLKQQKWISQELLRFWTSGYLFSGLDSLAGNGIYIHRGEKSNGEIRRMLVFRENPGRYDTLKEVEGDRLSRFLHGVLNEYINKGYPFASIRMDSLQFEDGKYQAFFSLNPGPKIVYDSIALLSGVNINKRFLENTFNMQKGAPFSEKGYQDIAAKIKRISFLELKQKPDVGFSDGKATVYLDLSQRATNSFEGVIGLLPNQSKGNGLVVTGYLDLVLSNLFRSGKALNLTWNRFADQSQSMDISYHHPYFLSSKIFLDAGFSLIKQDTTFLTQNWEVGVGSYLSNDLEIIFGYENINGSLITPDPRNLQAGFADYHTNLYAIGIRHSLYEQPFGFSNGFRFFSRFSLGEKKIETNPAIGMEWYDTLNRETILTNLESSMKYQYILRGGLAFYHKLMAGSIINNEILNNELVRLGGLKTIRGFNENFFFAQQYALSRLELRQYFEKQSYFLVFYDQLFYSQNNFWDYPHGFGAGLALQTSTGLFSFAAALGASENIPLDISNIKIHLGYISRF